MKRKRSILFGLLASGLTAGILLMHLVPATAFYNNNSIIDDWLFDQAGTMNAQQIDQFLNRFPNSCISINNGFKAPDPIGTSPSISGFYYGGDVTAGTVIYHASQAYGLNPQVILATLQKEEQMVDGTAGCSILRYSAAMGDACPDSFTSHNYSGFELHSINGVPVTSVTGTCVNNADEVGFSRQVITATWKLKFWEQRSEGNVKWAPSSPGWDNSNAPLMCYYYTMTQGYFSRCSGNPTVYFDGFTTIDNTSVHLDNGATSALYTYTPHFHGNQLFRSIFEQWFGLAGGEGYILATSYTDNGDPRQWVVYHGMRRLVPDTATLQAWGLDKANLIQWPGTLLGSYPTQDNTNNNAFPLSRLMRPAGSLDVYFVDMGNSYKVTSGAMLSAWNFPIGNIQDVSTGLSQAPNNMGELKYSIRNTADTSGAIYMADGGVLRHYINPDVLTAWEGNSPSYTTISDAYFKSLSVGGDITSAKAQLSASGSQSYGVVAAQKLPLSSDMANVYVSPAMLVSTATLQRLVDSSPASKFVRVAGTTTVYMVDSFNGVTYKHQVSSPAILQAWGGSDATVNIITQGNLNLYTNGSALNTFEADVSGQLYLIDGRKIPVPAAIDSAYRTNNVYSASAALMNTIPAGATASNFIKGNSASVYLLDNTVLRNIGSPNQLNLWNHGGPITNVSDSVLAQFGSPGTQIGAYVSDGSTNYVVEGGVFHKIPSVNIQTAWNLINPAILNSATINRWPKGSDLGTSLQFGGTYYMVIKGVAYATVDNDIAQIWKIDVAPTINTTLVQEYLSLNMLTRFVRSNLDTSVYVVENQTLYHLSPAHAANFGLTSLNQLMIIDPTGYTGADWNSVVVSSPDGINYVIDNGGKRAFPNSQVQIHWTSGATIPAVSRGFVNLLPSSGIVDRAIKGSSNTVYDIHTDSGSLSKHWVSDPSYFTSCYGRFEQVSDQLLNVLSLGQNQSTSSCY
ncbi:MAG: hypothetical protein NVS1B7_1510 [Candidatus Saccharimonadales bacterium]